MMRTEQKNIRKRLAIWAVVISGLLLIPALGTKFSQEVNWDVSDFIIMGSVLIGVALAYEFIARRSQKSVYRSAFGIGILGAFLLFWVNGAVGIIGNESQPANLLYGAVFVVGLVGSLISKFKPKGMSITLFTAAIVQMLVPVVALLIWPPPETSWSPSVFVVFLLSAFFASLFIISGVLFNRANPESDVK